MEIHFRKNIYNHLPLLLTNSSALNAHRTPHTHPEPLENAVNAVYVTCIIPSAKIFWSTCCCWFMVHCWKINCFLKS